MRPPNYPVIHIKGMHFKNPFLVLPGTTELTNPNGRVTPELLMYYKALSQSEAALVIVGPATVTPPNSRKYSLLRVDQPKYLDGLRALSKIVSSNGAIPGIQVTHPGTWEANDLQSGAPPFVNQLGELSLEKVVTAFRNACSRSLEVGFRYVELDGRGGLALHQLIEAHEEDAIRQIFANGVKAMGDKAVIALRLSVDSQHRDHYAQLFRDLGGDLVCLDATGTEPEAFFETHKGACIENLYERTPADDIYKRLERSRLLSMDLDFPDKRKQVTSFF